MKRLTSILATVLLLAAMATMAGCSKDSENMEEQQLNDMKQHIVGTWVKHGEAYVDDRNNIKAHVHNGITDGIDVLFDVDMTPPSEYTPNTLTIKADGTLVIAVNGQEPISGTYELTAISDQGFNTFLPSYVIRKDVEHFDFDFKRSQIYSFRYVFFEKSYNTAYSF